MNRKNWLIVLSVLIVPAALSDFGPRGRALAQQPNQQISKVVSQVRGALARLEFSVDNRIIPPVKRFGQCVCIDASAGVFVTLDVPGGMPAGELKDFTLVVPGVGGKRIKAELMGTDAETGFSFIRATEKHTWSQVRFGRRSGLQVGQRVLSVGLLGPQTGNVPYVGVGMVSAVVRIPQQLVFINGGDLTTSSSPVLTEDGVAVGMVGVQIPMEYRLLTAGRWANVGISGRQNTRFFIPVEEFAGALTTRGKGGRLPWMGVAKFHAVLPEQVKVMGLGQTQAVMVGVVIDKNPSGRQTPAVKAGIKQGDVVVAFEGAPLERMATPGITLGRFERRLLHCKPGQRVSLTLRRDGKQHTVQVELEAMPKRPFEAQRYYDARLGMIARDLVLLDRYAGRDKPLVTNGVAVIAVRRDSPVARGQLQRGDLVTAVNGKVVPTVAVLRSVIEEAARTGAGKAIEFIVQRGDKPYPLSIIPGQ